MLPRFRRQIAVMKGQVFNLIQVLRLESDGPIPSGTPLE